MKRHSIIDEYKAAGYPESAIECLHYLESRTDHLGDFLDRYRHLRLPGKLFSPEVLGVIQELSTLEEYIIRLEELIESLQREIPPNPNIAPAWDF